jgi:hypothetical protein
MAELVSNCPRCGAKKITFDVSSEVLVGKLYDWQHVYEAFCVCRQCGKSSIHVLIQKDIHAADRIRNNKLSEIKSAALNTMFKDQGALNLADNQVRLAPEYVPDRIKNAFEEGAKCLNIHCFNAAGTMFRLCVDFATFDLLPDPASPNGPKAKEQRDLGLRLPWLFNNGLLPEALHSLASCIKDDGNDGAHKGTLTEDEALDLLDFSSALLERLYTEPKQLELAQQRRDARRAVAQKPSS